MLAERKKKTKWVINPTKKPLWALDSSGIKFGKEMMEKMGWSTGKGLGVKEQGIVEPLKVSYKNDTKGMGFRGSDENWIEHQDKFNTLLSQLSSCVSDISTQSTVKEKKEIQSLEEKSKKSKARVHYQKFTRGKDLSRYSENDLACILGTNKIKEKKSLEEKKKLQVEQRKTENCLVTSFGVSTINSGSINDYFKKKLAGKSVNHTETECEKETTENNFFDSFLEYNFEPSNSKEKPKKRKLDSIKLEKKNGYGITNFDPELDLKQLKNQVKKKKTGMEDLNFDENGINDIIIMREEELSNSNAMHKETYKKKNKNKSKKNFEINVTDSQIHEANVLESGMNINMEQTKVKPRNDYELYNKTHKKKKKHKENKINIENRIVEEAFTENGINLNAKKEKKKPTTQNGIGEELVKKKQKENKSIYVEGQKIEKAVCKNEIKINKKETEKEPHNGNESGKEPCKRKKRGEKKQKQNEDRITNENQVCEETVIDRISESMNETEKEPNIYNQIEKQISKREKKAQKGEKTEGFKTEKVQENHSEKKNKKKKKKASFGEEEHLVGSGTLEEKVFEYESPSNIFIKKNCLEMSGKDKKNKEEKTEEEKLAKFKTDEPNWIDETEEISFDKKKSKKKRKDKEMSKNVDSCIENTCKSSTLSNVKENLGSDVLLKSNNDKLEETIKNKQLVVHSHKPELFNKKKLPKSNNNAQFFPEKYSSKRVLQLLCNFVIDDFKGCNLSNLPGYGTEIYKKQKTS